MRNVPRALLMLIASLILAACGQTGSELTPEPTPEPTGYTVSGTVADVAPYYIPQGIVLIMADTDALGTTDVAEVLPGMYISEMALVDADGSFDLVLPRAAELPEGVLVPATDFVRSPGVPCSLTASTPSARVSQYVVVDGLLFVPAVAFVEFQGTAFSFTTAEAIDVDVDVFSDHTFISWVFATEDVSVVSAEAGCDYDGDTLHVAVDLVAGWNQVASSFEVDPVTDDIIAMYLNSFDGEELHFNPITN